MWENPVCFFRDVFFRESGLTEWETQTIIPCQGCTQHHRLMWIDCLRYIIFHSREQHVSAQNSHHLSWQLYDAKQLSEVLNLRRTRMTWQLHVKKQQSSTILNSCPLLSDFKPLRLLFSNLYTSPPLFSSSSTLSAPLSASLSFHPSLSRTTGACLLSSQCFYSLALAQGSIQSGPCIHFPSHIIHMLMWKRAAFTTTHDMTLIEHCWPFDSLTCSSYESNFKRYKPI